MITVFKESRELQRVSHKLIPGGCHTYAKGDDQYPDLAPGFIARGNGCHVWDADGNQYIEYGMGLRSVTLGHAFSPVVQAAQEQLLLGSNFTRPSPIEVNCAKDFLRVIKNAEQVKFTKDGSTATTAAVKLARACTGRDMVGICAEHPFLSYDDWFIGTTPLNAGIPKAVRDLTVTFRYNDIHSVQQLFDHYPGQIACLILEPSRNDEPHDEFLDRLQLLCRQNGSLLIFDETITGFRYHLGGGQEYYGIDPDLSVFGKALANGFALSALAGKRQYMRLGGLEHDQERVFLLSTTHGSETHALAAAIAAMRTYRNEPVIEHLDCQGTRLAEGFRRATYDLGLSEHVNVVGKACNLSFFTLDSELKPSQSLRSLFLQETIKRGILMPSLVVSYAHTDDDIDRTIEVIRESLHIYRQALADGVDKYLVGSPSKVVFRRYN